ncbi:MAG TPA: hypothetical protein DD397_06590 [Hyphomonas sp.]|nr:hypothetical protein [Hyphomonas sp.]|tara:strand:- start:5607 stop:5909 length:303 start_codon:yes stop_codon:yes gene_type:complete
MVEVIATRKDLLEGFMWPEHEPVATCASMFGGRRVGTTILTKSNVREYLGAPYFRWRPAYVKHVNETRARMDGLQWPPYSTNSPARSESGWRTEGCFSNE